MKHVHNLKTNLAEFCVTTGLDYIEQFILFGTVFQNQFFRGIMYINKEHRKRTEKKKTLQFDLYLKKPK